MNMIEGIMGRVWDIEDSGLGVREIVMSEATFRCVAQELSSNSMPKSIADEFDELPVRLVREIATGAYVIMTQQITTEYT